MDLPPSGVAAVVPPEVRALQFRRMMVEQQPAAVPVLGRRNRRLNR
jgi:hypothetical protein